MECIEVFRYVCRCVSATLVQRFNIVGATLGQGVLKLLIVGATLGQRFLCGDNVGSTTYDRWGNVGSTISHLLLGQHRADEQNDVGQTL